MAQSSQKGPPHASGVAETSLAGDLVERTGTGLDGVTRRIEPQLLNCLCRRTADFAEKRPGEISGAHRGIVGQLLDRERQLDVVLDPADESLEATGLAAAFEEPGKLGLAAGTAAVHHELLRRAAGEGSPEIVLDQGQRQVDAGRDAG